MSQNHSGFPYQMINRNFSTIQDIDFGSHVSKSISRSLKVHKSNFWYKNCLKLRLKLGLAVENGLFWNGKGFIEIWIFPNSNNYGETLLGNPA